MGLYTYEDVIYGRFIWNRRKNEENKSKHKLSFEKASEVYADPFTMEQYDEAHSTETEERHTVIGIVNKVVVIFLVTTEQGDRIRIISARKAERKEQEAYYEHIRSIAGY
ncbi:MAG: BrnT family toxin [Treponema sp.]|jgi:uncharacterized DUF497 family protein|nr:BrnT family toxin [Treponema sp.]